MRDTSMRQPSLKELAARCLSGTDKGPSVGPVDSIPLPADLERRLRAMAKRWDRSDDEVTGMLHRACTEPIQWLAAVARDERCEREFHKRGLLKPDA